MSQTPQKEKKNRFQVSREVQAEFVNGVAETMLSLAETAGKWQKPWTADTPLGMPYCPMTSREYGGANLVRLMLTSIVKGYGDDRWMTFKQLEKYRADNPDMEMHIRKGEKGVTLLRPQDVMFTIEEDGRWKFLSDEEIKRIAELKEQGREVPEVQRKTLFYPFTVFNASQVEGFPQKEQPAHTMTEIECNDFVEKFIASSGVAVEHHGGDAEFKHDADVIKMPFPDRFTGTDEYYSAKLHEFYHATGHKTRENRQKKQEQTLKEYAFEEMRAEMFSMLAGARLNLPMPESNSAAYINHWNQTFSAGDVREVFKAAAEAARALTTMHQFEAGEQPTAHWFPKREAWPELVAMQKERDAAAGINIAVREKVDGDVQVFERVPRAQPLNFSDSAAAFQATDDPVVQARLILQNPQFLEMALKQDPDSVRNLASLCDSVSQVLHMELDEKLRSAPGAVENPVPLNEQQAASERRMRM